MPVRIDRVETEMVITPSRGAAGARADDPGASGDKKDKVRHGSGGGLGISDEKLKEKIKPMVLDILTEEIYRLKRRGDLH